MSIAWATVQSALQAWAVAGTGLAADKCVWAGQDGPRPTGSHVVMRVRGVRRIGQDWLDRADTVAPSAGQEITFKARGQREVVIDVQCFAPANGASGAAMLLDGMIANATLETRRAALLAAGVGLAYLGPVQALDGVINSIDFDPRALFECRLFLASEITEYVTNIQTVEVTNLTNGDVFEIP